MNTKFIITNVHKIYDYYYKLPENDDLFSGSFIFSDYLVNGEDKIVLALLDNKIIGFCLLHEINPGIWVKEAISVHSHYRCKGIATQMIFIAFNFVNEINGKMTIGKYSQNGKNYLHKINLRYSQLLQIYLSYES